MTVYIVMYCLLKWILYKKMGTAQMQLPKQLFKMIAIILIQRYTH